MYLRPSSRVWRHPCCGQSGKFKLDPVTPQQKNFNQQLKGLKSIHQLCPLHILAAPTLLKAARGAGPYSQTAPSNIKDQRIKTGSPTALEKADDWIRNERYTSERLKIERLSGAALPIEQCYINLVIVAQDTHQGKGTILRITTNSRLPPEKVIAMDDMFQFQLAKLFDQRSGHDGRMIQPRRILIRGCAGVRKTTLCKRIVHDFILGTQMELYNLWTKLFDRVLWVPLRNLKGQQEVGYNLNKLLYLEYFSECVEGEKLAKELSSDCLER